MPVGTVGGALKSHPTYALVHRLLGNPDAAGLSCVDTRLHVMLQNSWIWSLSVRDLLVVELAMIIAAVGLAQNLAAIRALATEGIQRGHMALHARNVAVAALGGPTAGNHTSFKSFSFHHIESRSRLRFYPIVSALDSKMQGEGTRRLELIAAHLATSGTVTATAAKSFLENQGWSTEVGKS